MNQKPNPKKTTIEAAPIEADDALARFTQLSEALAQTHNQIPKLLRDEQRIAHDLGIAEATGKDAAGLRESLAASEADRKACARRRAACIDGILGLESELRSMRQEAWDRQQKAADAVAREFGERWRAACDVLSRLQSEAALLSRHLRCDIRTPLPELRPVMPEPAVDVPAHVQEAGRKLDGLDSAIGRIGGIRQAKKFDANHYELLRLRNTPATIPGVYVCQKSFDCLEDGLPFAPGSLVDSTVIGPGMFSRLVSTRHVRPAELQDAANAA